MTPSRGAGQIDGSDHHAMRTFGQLTGGIRGQIGHGNSAQRRAWPICLAPVLAGVGGRFAELDHDIARLAVVDHIEFDGGSGTHRYDLELQGAAAFQLLSIEAGDDIAGLNPGPLRRAIVGDRSHQGAGGAGEMERRREILRHRLYRYAQPSSADFAGLEDRFHH